MWIRICAKQSLIFSFLLISCFKSNDKPPSLSIRWDKDKATGIFVPRNFLANTPEDSIQSLLHIHLLKEQVQPAILGEWILMDESVLFEPLIPLTRGLTYDVRLRGKSLGEVQVPLADSTDAPAVISVYPTKDTLPHNLLKMYVQFSKPMQAGQALKHIVLIKNEVDTVQSVFLDLRPELWNNDRTILTLWLDPGRIKRDLQPNKTMGEPLQQKARYQLLIRQDWQDIYGASLKQVYRKNFFVAQRDSVSPNPDLWTIHAPKAGSTQSLQVDFHEPLDYVLLRNAVRITNPTGNVINGKLEVSNKETMLNFTPASVWKSDTYILETESRLEDLAGNNLNRSFDRDINLIKTSETKEVFKRYFQIQ